MNDECIEDWNHYMQSQKILKNKQTKKKQEITEDIIDVNSASSYEIFLN